MATGTEEKIKKPRNAEKLQHLEGCPQLGADPDSEESLSRIEEYRERRPVNQGGAWIRITRCQDCGAHYTKEEGR